VATLVFGIARGVLTIGGWRGGLETGAACAVAVLVYGIWGLRLLDPGLRATLWLFFGQVVSARRGAS
jgi:hypothetical protein